MIPPHVETSRLSGDRPEPGDAERLAPVLADEQLAAWLWPGALGGPRTFEQTQALVAADIAHWDTLGLGPWIVRERGAVIGRIGLMRTDVADEHGVEVAWLISPERWGRGLATEMAAEAVRAGFEDHGLAELISFTQPGNLASRAIMRKLGFSYERDVVHAGLPHVLYRLRAARRPTSVIA